MGGVDLGFTWDFGIKKSYKMGGYIKKISGYIFSLNLLKMTKRGTPNPSPPPNKNPLDKNDGKMVGIIFLLNN